MKLSRRTSKLMVVSNATLTDLLEGDWLLGTLRSLAVCRPRARQTRFVSSFFFFVCSFWGLTSRRILLEFVNQRLVFAMSGIDCVKRCLLVRQLARSNCLQTKKCFFGPLEPLAPSLLQFSVDVCKSRLLQRMLRRQQRPRRLRLQLHYQRVSFCFVCFVVCVVCEFFFFFFFFASQLHISHFIFI
jgi:hypothetical protein